MAGSCLWDGFSSQLWHPVQGAPSQVRPCWFLVKLALSLWGVPQEDPQVKGLRPQTESLEEPKAHIQQLYEAKLCQRPHCMQRRGFGACLELRPSWQLHCGHTYTCIQPEHPSYLCPDLAQNIGMRANCVRVLQLECRPMDISEIDSRIRISVWICWGMSTSAPHFSLASRGQPDLSPKLVFYVAACCDIFPWVCRIVCVQHEG